MPALPGSKPFNASLVGWTCESSDALFSGSSGGVIQFDDGTIWTYQSTSPAGGDQENAFTWDAPDGFKEYWLHIFERKPNSEVWECLTPDLWGSPDYDTPPNHTKWPTIDNWPSSGWLNFANVDNKGQLEVANVGFWHNQLWDHVIDPRDPDTVWFFSSNSEQEIGPIKVSRSERSWERFLTSSTSTQKWQDRQTNTVVYGPYFYFMRYDNAAVEMVLCRAEISDPNNVIDVHGFDASTGWRTNQITTELVFPDYLQNQYLMPARYGLGVDGDYIYLTDYGFIGDSRSTGGFTSASREYRMEFSRLMRFKIGDYQLELLYWHTSKQGFVGVGTDESGNSGTLFAATIGVYTEPVDRINADNDNWLPAIGMGFKPSDGVVYPVIKGGWLYWMDESLENVADVYGMICRMNIAEAIAGAPVKHNPLDPGFEIIAGGTKPWESWQGHFGHEGTFLRSRLGPEPILPWVDNFQVLNDGSLLVQTFNVVPYYTDTNNNWAIIGLVKLSKSEVTTKVTLTFTGDELKGYPYVRQVPVTRNTIEVELS